MIDQQPVLAELKEGDDVTGMYILSRCDLREYDGGVRLDIELRDATARIAGVVWDDARELAQVLTKGMVVKMQGRLSSYRDQLQMKVERIREAREDEYELSWFLPETPEDIDTLRSRLLSFVSSIEDTDLSRLVRLIFENEQVMHEFMRAPGGARWHHPYLGGLAEHTVGVTEICDFIASTHPELNRDLLVLAALLHDIGKIREFSITTEIDYSDEGRLEGHIVLGERFVRNMCERIEGFPPKLKMLLSHLILAHQGFHAFSTPVEPMIPEGFVLYYADEIDSKLNALARIRDKNEGKSWSDYVKLLSRFIYLDRDEQEDDNDTVAES